MIDSKMKINISQHQGRVPITIFKIKGELDANVYEDLEKQAQQAYDAGMRNLILDLSEVHYISSSGLRALHHIFMLLRAGASTEDDEAMKKGLRDGSYKSPHLKLLNPSPHVSQVLQTSGFDMFLEVHRRLKDAVASF